LQGLTTSLEFRREVLQAGFKATNRTVTYLLAYLIVYLLAYLPGGVLLLFSGWPGPLAALLVLPYVAVCAAFWNVTDAAADTANGGWRRFLRSTSSRGSS